MAHHCNCLRKEFQLKNFGLSGTNEEKFYFLHWRLPPILCILYRLCFAVYLIYWLVYILCCVNHQFPWATWLTHWTYLILSLYFAIGFITTTLYHLCFNRGYSLCSPMTHDEHRQIMLQNTSDYEPIPGDRNLLKIGFLTKIVWILYNIASNVSIMVTIIFFSFLLKGSLSSTNLQQHLLNSVIVLLDQLITGVPVRILHCIYPELFCFAYIIFSVFYWSADHSNVLYPGVLDWNYPAHTIGMVIICGLGVFLLQLLLFSCYHIKQFVLKFS